MVPVVPTTWADLNLASNSCCMHILIPLDIVRNCTPGVVAAMDASAQAVIATMISLYLWLCSVQLPRTSSRGRWGYVRSISQHKLDSAIQILGVLAHVLQAHYHGPS